MPRLTSQLRTWGAGVALAALVGGLLASGPPASAQPAYGMLVGGVAFPSIGFYAVAFSAQPGMVQSDVVVRRTGNSLVIFEEDGGPSLGVGNSTFCTSSNPSGPSSEVTCTFPAPVPNGNFWAWGDFSNAPRGASLVIEEGSQVVAYFRGSPFDDYFQGGDLPDAADGDAGNDNIYGGGGDDALYGSSGEDDMEGEAGSDRIYGGPDADNIIGGGDADLIVAGLGVDDVESKDSTSDIVDCGEPSLRTSSTPDEGDKLEYDAKLDKVTACNVSEWPSAINPPSLSTLSVKVGETVTGNMGSWTGTLPMTYTYAFSRCPSQFGVWSPKCTVVKSGKLDERGNDGATRPTYKATKADVNSFLQFSVTASNLPKIGASATASASTGIVGPPASVTILGNWLPRKVNGEWIFGNWVKLQDAILASPIGQYVDIIADPVRRVTVPAPWRRAVIHDTVVSLEVNDKPVPVDGSVKVEASADERASIHIKYYSWWEDRSTCPVTDEDLKTINSWLASGSMSLWLLTRHLDTWNGKGGCEWVIDWSDEVSKQDYFVATGIAVEDRPDNPDVPVRLRITATKPSLRPRLNLAVGAPPRSYVQRFPEEFSIAADGRLYDFPGAGLSSVWVGLLGDQVRETSNRAYVEVFVNGQRTEGHSFDSVGGEGSPFSALLSIRNLEPGTARIVVSTLDSWGNMESQVFVDFIVADGSKANPGDLITWDGRCFSNAGLPTTCPTTYNASLGAMRNTVDSALNGELAYFATDPGALRHASAALDKRFLVVGANGLVTSQGVVRNGRARDCWWIDLFCHLQNKIDAQAQTVVKPKNTTQKQRAYRKVVILPINAASMVGAVIGEGILKVPGAGLINLDGGTLINLDGGTVGPFTRELSELINLDGGTVVGTNGATVVGTNGGTFVGVDAASLLNSRGGRILSDAGGALISDAGGAFSPLTLLSRG